MRKCDASADGSLGGPRCGKQALYATLLGDRCAEHIEAFRAAARNPNTLINVLAGKVPTAEEIEKKIRPITEGDA
jgi:hypothetical protein